MIAGMFLILMLFQSWEKLMWFCLFMIMYSMLKIEVGVYSSFLTLDLKSYGLIFLLMWLMMLVEVKLFNLSYMIRMLNLLNFLMLSVLYLCFMVNNLFYFYIFFELALIPIMLMLMVWGYNTERLQAGIYMFFYTLLISLPLLMMVIYFSIKKGKLMFYDTLMFTLDNWLLVYLMVGALMVKLPVYLLHLWLPKAHVQAPVYGSMLLAGILLKLGGYGMVRLFMMLKFSKMNSLIAMGLVGGLLMGLMGFRQVDVKMLVAYSSISHMSMMMVGLLSYFNMGLKGALMMMVGHGLCSSAMFFMIDEVYKELGSRSFILMKGMVMFSFSSLWWFMISVCNMGSPPSLNLMSEILLLSCMVYLGKLFIIMFILLSFVSTIYSLYLFIYSNYGEGGWFISIKELPLSSYILLSSHWVLMNLIILKLEIF